MLKIGCLWIVVQGTDKYMFISMFLLVEVAHIYWSLHTVNSQYLKVKSKIFPATDNSQLPISQSQRSSQLPITRLNDIVPRKFTTRYQ